MINDHILAYSVCVYAHACMCVRDSNHIDGVSESKLVNKQCRQESKSRT